MYNTQDHGNYECHVVPLICAVPFVEGTGTRYFFREIIHYIHGGCHTILRMQRQGAQARGQVFLHCAQLWYN